MLSGSFTNAQFTTVSNWQGVTNTIANNHHLVTNSAIYSALNNNIYTYTGANLNFRDLVLSIPEDVRKKYLTVRYNYDNVEYAKIRISDFSNASEWADINGWQDTPTNTTTIQLYEKIYYEIFKNSYNILDNVFSDQPKITEFTAEESVINNNYGFLIKTDVIKVFNKFKYWSNKYLFIVFKTTNLTNRAQLVVYKADGSYINIPSSNTEIYGDICVVKFDLSSIIEVPTLLSTYVQRTKITQSSAAKFEFVGLYISDGAYKLENEDLNYYKQLVFKKNSGKYVTVQADNKVNVHIPKGVNIQYRDGITIYFEDFSLPWSKVCSLKMTSDNQSLLNLLSFNELAYGPNYNIFARLTPYSTALNRAIDNLDGTYSRYYTISITPGNYLYNGGFMYLGYSGSYVTTEDIIGTLKIEYLSASKDNSFTERLAIDCRKAIGKYTTDYIDPFDGVISKSENVEFANSSGKSFSIDEGTDIYNEYFEIRIAVNKVTGLGINLPASYNISMMTNSYNESELGIVAELYTSSGALVETLATDYSELYNGVVKLGFNVTRLFSETEYVILKVKFTANNTSGLTVSIFDCSVANLNSERTISERLDDLEYNIRPLIVKSPNGTKFKISVDNEGNLTSSKAAPEKMLVMAHSWGLIPKNPSVGWYGNWSASASAENLDLTHQIENQIKLVNNNFEASYYRFAVFSQFYKDESIWETNQELCGMQSLDFDSICLCSFATAESDYTGWGEAFTRYVNNVLLVKSDGTRRVGVKIYMIKQACAVPDNEVNIAVSNLGIELIDIPECVQAQGTAHPWLMPKADNGTQVTKATGESPSGSEYVLSWGMVNHPGNYGYYLIGKHIKNSYCTEFAINNPDSVIKTINQYVQQPEVAIYKDTSWSGWQ